MAEVGDNEYDPQMMDTSAEKQGSDSCPPENVHADLNEISRVDSENKVHVQAYIIAENVKDCENKTSLIITEKQENKSLFLRAIELSPCQQGVKKLSCEKAESPVSNTAIEMKAETMTIENDYYASVVSKKDVKDSETEYLDLLENKDNLDFKGTSEIDSEYNGPDHNKSAVRGNENEAVKIEKADKDCSYKAKDVHFSSPLAVIHEYKVSQASCSQSTVNLSDSNDSQNLDDDEDNDNEGISETLSKANDNLPGSFAKTAAATITPGGDCFSVQVNENIDCEKEKTQSKLSIQESILTECQRTDKITETVSLESEINDQFNPLPIMKENLAIETGKESSTIVLSSSCALKTPSLHYDLEAGTSLITQERFNKHPLPSKDVEHVLRASQEMFSEELIKPLNAEKILPSDSLIESCLNKNRMDEFGTAVDIKKDNKVIDNNDICDDYKTDITGFKTIEGSEKSHSSCNVDTTEISLSEAAENSQDLFESSPDQTVVVSNESEKEKDNQTVVVSNDSEKEKDTSEITPHVKAEQNDELQGNKDKTIKDVTADDESDINVEVILKDEKVLSDMKENEEIQEVVKYDSQNDLFDSSERIMKSESASEWKKKSDNGQERNLDGNKDQIIDTSFEVKDNSQKDLFESDVVNADKISEDKEDSNDTEMSNDVITSKVEDSAKEMEDSSQKDLFESDISSDSISPEQHIPTSQNEIKYNQNQCDEIPEIINVEDAKMGENEDKMKTKIMPSPLEKEAVGMVMECRGKEFEDTRNDEIVNTGEKRKANKWAENPPLKSLKVSDEDKLVLASSIKQGGPRKRNSLFKNLVQNESEQPAKKAKSCEPEADQSENEIESPIIPFGIKPLAEIASNVINSLEEDLIWRNEVSNSGVDHNIKSRDEHSELVSTNKVSSDLQNSNTNLNIAAVTKLESNNYVLGMSNGLKKCRENKEIESEPVTINGPLNMVTEETSVVPCKPSCLPSESDQQNENQIRNGNDDIIVSQIPGKSTTEQVTGSPVFVSALEYHSQCSQNSSTGFEPKTVSQDIVMSSQGSDHSVPVVCGKDVHIVTEVYEEGIETTDLNKTGINCFFLSHHAKNVSCAFLTRSDSNQAAQMYRKDRAIFL